MHILRNNTPLPINYGQTLPPGEWLVQDEQAFRWASAAERGSVRLEVFNQVGRFSANPKQILLIRSGAIGDLLLLSPCIAALKAKYPQAQIWLSHFEKHTPIFHDFGVMSAHYPMAVSALSQFDLIIPLENIVENSTEKGVHATDAFAEALGVSVIDYKPTYTVTNDEKRAALTRYPRPTFCGGDPIQPKPRVALQLRASARIRDYHMQQWGEVVNTLLQRGWQIMLIGKDNPSDTNKLGPNIKDCSALSFREAAAVLATCDVFCGVDSSFFNLCPALGVPAIGLFGPVDWRTRIKEGSGQLALAGVGDCAPCGWTNSRGGQKFPPTGPCAKVGFCVPLAEIKPARVVAVIEREAKK